jgi:hypothetical protein
MARLHPFLTPILSCLLVLGGCEKGLQWRMPTKIIESIPFAPLEVYAGVQTVYLGAYWSDLNLLDSVTFSAGFQGNWVKGMDSLLIRASDNAPPIGRMQFWSAGFAYTLPLIRRSYRSQTFTLHDPDQLYTSVNLVTSFSETKATAFAEGRWTFTTRVPEGIQAYAFQANGMPLRRDPSNADSIFWPGMGMVSLIPADPRKDNRNTCRTLAFTGTQVRLSRDLSPQSVIALWNNIEIPFDTADGALRLEIPKDAKKVPISYLRVWIYNDNRITGSCKIPLIKGKVPVDTASIPGELWEAAVRYELMTDRFFNGDPTNDRKSPSRSLPHPKVDFCGGDFAGIGSKIRDGYFRELGINFLQISPVVRNMEGLLPAENCPNGIATAFDGRYPVSAVESEPGFGSEGALKQLLEQAESAGLNMALEPPSTLFRQDGSTTTLSSDSALFWFRKFNAAVWMQTGSSASAKQSAAIASAVRRFGNEENGRQLLIGFDGSFQSNTNQVSSHYHAQAYNSPEFYALAFSTFAFKASSTSASELLTQYIASFTNLKIRFHSTGSEWLPRFISLADGSLHPNEDFSKAGWNHDIQNRGEKYFSRLQSLFALCCALPGIPGIYHGDEIAMPGGGPPDNHRVMRFEGLSSVQTDHRDAMARLVKFRRSHPVLMFGDIRVLESAPGVLAIERQYFGRSIWAVFNLNEQAAVFVAPQMLTRSFRGQKLQTNANGVTINLEPNSYDFIY